MAARRVASTLQPEDPADHTGTGRQLRLHARTDHPAMATGSRQMTPCTSPAQPGSTVRKSVLAQPYPGLLRGRDGPGRGIHHHEPERGHRLHQVPTRFDNRGLPDVLEEPLRRVPAVPTGITDGQMVSEFRRSAIPPSRSNITTRSLPVTSPTLATRPADIAAPRPPRRRSPKTTRAMPTRAHSRTAASGMTQTGSLC